MTQKITWDALEVELFYSNFTGKKQTTWFSEEYIISLQINKRYVINRHYFSDTQRQATKAAAV